MRRQSASSAALESIARLTCDGSGVGSGGCGVTIDTQDGGEIGGTDIGGVNSIGGIIFPFFFIFCGFFSNFFPPEISNLKNHRQSTRDF